MTDLVGLEGVDWETLSHAPGVDDAVPALLRALACAPPSQRASALSDLKKAIHPRYATYPASSAAVPFLVQIALDTERDDTAALLEMLARLAVGQVRTAEGVDIRDAVDRWRVEMLHGGLATYEAVRDSLPRLLAVATHHDPAVRGALAFLLAQFADSPLASLAIVRSWLAAETDPLARTSLLLAARLLARYCDDPTDVPLFEELVAKGNGKDLETVAAALAVQHLIPEHPRAMKLLRSAKPSTPAGFVWGDLKVLAAQVVREQPLWARSMVDLVEWLESPPCEGDPLDSFSVILHVLYRFLAHHTGSYRLATDLPDLLRRAIAGALRRGDQITPHSDVWLHFYGIPYKTSLGRWLGVDPPTALEMIIPGPREWPTWKWLKAALLGEVTREAAVAAASSVFSPSERAALLRDPFPIEYDFQGHLPLYHYVSVEADTARHAMQTLMVDVLSTCDSDVVESEAALAMNGAPRSIHPVVLVTTLDRFAARDGRVRDSRWQPLAASARPNGSSILFREVVKATPVELREDILLRQVFGPWTSKTLGPDQKEVKTRTLAGAIDELIDLCPTPAVLSRFVAAIHREWPEYPEAEGLSIATRVGPPLAAPLLAALTELPESADPQERRYLIELLSAVGERQVLPHIPALAASEKPSDRKAATRCIQRLRERGVEVPVEKRAKRRTSAG